MADKLSREFVRRGQSLGIIWVKGDTERIYENGRHAFWEDAQSCLIEVFKRNTQVSVHDIVDAHGQCVGGIVRVDTTLVESLGCTPDLGRSYG